MASLENEKEVGNREDGDKSIEEALASIGCRMKKRQKMLDEREQELEKEWEGRKGGGSLLLSPRK